jgi:hypothetical protein
MFVTVAAFVMVWRVTVLPETLLDASSTASLASCSEPLSSYVRVYIDNLISWGNSIGLLPCGEGIMLLFTFSEDEAFLFYL